jgi:hypothetical protein
VGAEGLLDAGEGLGGACKGRESIGSGAVNKGPRKLRYQSYRESFFPNCPSSFCLRVKSEEDSFR